ncbi:MAG: crosslink repair DNA glycosylase YcaQ family protein [Pseudomonadota bacterium]
MAICAQGAGLSARKTAGGRAELRRLVDKLGVLQIDSVNVLARAHLLPPFSRLGCYDVQDLDSLAYGGKRRALFEYWGHAASLLPVDLHPLFRWRMEDAAAGRGVYPDLARFGADHQRLLSDLLDEVARRGPSVVGDFRQHANRAGGWWGWSDAKTGLEWLFWAGMLTTARRGPAFERVYDLPERALPAKIIAAPTPSRADAQRALIERAARAMGVATEGCLADYYRLSPKEARPAIATLVESGVLRAVCVEGWEKPAYAHAKARLAKAFEARALLAPFDPLIWRRERAEALFGARIRIEIYVPRPKRVHGYYVLPFLLGDRIMGRVDLKADRQAKTLRVLSAHSEPGAAMSTFVDPLAEELRLMADWLGLPRLSVSGDGDAAAALQGALRF